jgi:hypothetical protein
VLYTTGRTLYDLLIWLVCKSGGPAVHSYPSFNIFLTFISLPELEYMKTWRERTEGIRKERERKGFLCKSVKPPKSLCPC